MMRTCPLLVAPPLRVEPLFATARVLLLAVLIVLILKDLWCLGTNTDDGQIVHIQGSPEGIGKRLKGLQVQRPGGRKPGLGRGLMRILPTILAVEGVRMPLLLAFIDATHIDALSAGEIVLYVALTTLGPCIPILLTLGARREGELSAVVALGTWTVMSLNE